MRWEKLGKEVEVDAMQVATDVMNKIARIREEKLKTVLESRSLADLHCVSTRTPNGEQEEYYQGNNRLMTFKYYFENPTDGHGLIIFTQIEGGETELIEYELG